jgi:hypothetical protein
MQAMNDSHESELPDDKLLQGDPILDAAFLQLRRLEPSADGWKLNRTVVADELQRLATAEKKLSVPWWRKTIAVPVPLAAAALSLAALALFSGFRSGQAHPQTPVVTPTQPARSLPDAQGAGVVAGADGTKKTKTVGYYETETYLCGIGRLKSESGWLIPEDNQ